MAVVALKLKILPSSPDADLEELEEKLKENLEKAGAIKVNSVEKEPIAFGLNSLIITLAWPEEQDTDKAEQACQIENITSVEILDYRRAVG